MKDIISTIVVAVLISAILMLSGHNLFMENKPETETEPEAEPIGCACISTFFKGSYSYMCEEFSETEDSVGEYTRINGSWHEDKNIIWYANIDPIKKAQDALLRRMYEEDNKYEIDAWKHLDEVRKLNGGE